jgi:hypothetical protein
MEPHLRDCCWLGYNAAMPYLRCTSQSMEQGEPGPWYGGVSRDGVIFWGPADTALEMTPSLARRAQRALVQRGYGVETVESTGEDGD